MREIMVDMPRESGILGKRMATTAVAPALAPDQGGVMFVELHLHSIDRLLEALGQPDMAKRTVVIGRPTDQTFREAQDTRGRILATGATFLETKADQTFEEARAELQELLWQVQSETEKLSGTGNIILKDRPTEAAMAIYGNPPHPISETDFSRLTRQMSTPTNLWQED